MINVYVYSKCSTCQKALAFLSKKNVSFIKKEITETPPSLKDLKNMLHHKGNVRKIFNTSGQLYREMQLNEKLKNLSETEAFKLLSQKGMLVKRPFVLGKDFGLLGFNEAEWDKAFCSAH